MGFFNDTIRDARRPLGSAITLRRQVADELEADGLDESPPATGMQTVFRFQQANTLAAVSVTAPAREFREASIQPAVERPLPVSDPLTAGEERSKPAPNVLETDISVRGADRTSNLATGQEVSSSKVTAANVVPVSEVLQSVDSSGFSAPDSLHATQLPEIQAGSDTLVSPRSNASLSRPGRGASSEFFPHRSAPSRSAGQAASASAGRMQATATLPNEPATSFAQATTTSLAGDPRLPANATALPGPRRSGGLGRPHADLASPQASAPQAAEPRTTPAAAAEPRLVIGRIDVTVINSTPATAPAAQRTDRGFLSRNYLKRL